MLGLKQNVFWILTLLLSLTYITPVSAGRVVRVSSASEFRQKVGSAKPGDLILVDSGVYLGGFWFRELAGTPEEPIVIRAQDPANPPIIKGGANGIRLTGCRNVALEDMVFEDCAVHGVQVDFQGQWKPGDVSGISLSRLTVRRIGDLGNEDGIKCSGVWGLRIQDCTIERWGELGRSIDLVSCRDVVVLRCEFDGGNHSRIAFQIKGGSLNATIDRCFVKNTLERGYQIGGSTGAPYFLPSFEGFEAKNVKMKNCTSDGGECGLALVNARECSVENCLFINPQMWCLRILQENDLPGAIPCGENILKNNVFVFDSTKILNRFDVHELSDAASISALGNVWYDIQGKSSRWGTTPISEVGSVFGIDPLIDRDSKGVPRARKTFEDVSEEFALRGLNSPAVLSIFQVLAVGLLSLLALSPRVAQKSTGAALGSVEHCVSSPINIRACFVFLFALHLVAQMYPFKIDYSSLSTLLGRWCDSGLRPSRVEAEQSLAVILWSCVLGFVAMLGVRSGRSLFGYHSIQQSLVLLGLLIALVVVDWCIGAWFGADRFPGKHWMVSQVVGLSIGWITEFLFGPSLLRLLSYKTRRSNFVDFALYCSLFVWLVDCLVPFRLQADPIGIYYKIRSGLIDLSGRDFVKMGFGVAVAEVIRNIPIGILLSRFAVGYPQVVRTLRSSFALGFILLALREFFHFFVAFRSVSVSVFVIGLLGICLGSLLNQWMARHRQWWFHPFAPGWKLGGSVAWLLLAILFVLMVGTAL